MHSESALSHNTPLDIVFISYNESNAEENWQELKARFPRAKRVHGVKGIREAHQQAAAISESHFFYVVDGDNKICKDFDFESPKDLKDKALYVYRCRNPLNNLVYGYGAIKIYNKQLLENRKNKQYIDLATSVSEHYIILSEVASETHFFNTPEEAWRGAFRECFKLASQCIDRQDSQQTHQRLQRWCAFESSLKNSDWALLGARQGHEIALSQYREACNINDFQWLHQYFEQFAKA